MTRYKITIEEKTQERRIRGKQWERGAAEDGEGYGYTPEVETVETITRTIYTQNTDDLDLVAIIRAVNGISQ